MNEPKKYTIEDDQARAPQQGTPTANETIFALPDNMQPRRPYSGIADFASMSVSPPGGVVVRSARKAGKTTIARKANGKVLRAQVLAGCPSPAGVPKMPLGHAPTMPKPLLAPKPSAASEVEVIFEWAHEVGIIDEMDDWQKFLFENQLEASGYVRSRNTQAERILREVDAEHERRSKPFLCRLNIHTSVCNKYSLSAFCNKCGKVNP